MFDSTRRSFFVGAATLGQYDPCREHQDAMSAYAKKIAEFSRQMREALARGDKAAADQAASIAQDAGKKYEEHRRMYEKCRFKASQEQKGPAWQAPEGWKGLWPGWDKPSLPSAPPPPAPVETPKTRFKPGQIPQGVMAPQRYDWTTRAVPISPTAAAQAIAYHAPKIPFGFGPMFATGPMAYGGPTT